MSRIYLSPPDAGVAESEAIAEVLRSGWIAPAGPELGRFENEVAALCGREHAVAVSSGTAAIHLALLALGVGEGDTVLCPTFTFAATVNPAFYCKCRIELIDSDPATWNIDPRLLAQRLEAAGEGRAAPVAAIIACSIYGNCAGLAEIERIAEAHGVPLIEDAAEALGGRASGRAAGSFGAIAVFSFNGNKIITTSGGGMLVTNRADLAEQARYLSTQAREPVRHYEHRAVGYNYRMSNLLAALGRAQLARLGERIRRRREHFEAYTAHLVGEEPGALAAMPVAHWGEPNYWLSLFLTRGATERDRILDALEAADIEARPLWKPLHQQPAYARLVTHGGAVAESLFERGVALPSGNTLSDEQRQRVAGIVKDAAHRNR